MTMKMAIDGIIKPNPRACGVCGKSRQTVPVNIEAFMIERVDRLMKHMPFVDVFAVRQAGSNRQNAEMVTVAVYTARKFTSLRPHLIYDGNDNEFTDWLDRHGVRIIRHRSLFRAQLASWANVRKILTSRRRFRERSCEWNFRDSSPAIWFCIRIAM